MDTPAPPPPCRPHQRVGPPTNGLALARPFDDTVSPRVPRATRRAESDDVLATRSRRAIAIATVVGVDVVAAARIAEVFDTANAADGGYVVTTVAFEPTSCVAAPAERRWHTLVIPPIERWMGLDASMPLVRWIVSLVECADQVLAIGTGTFLLAAAGQLVDVDVVIDRAHAPMLSVLAPDAAVVDGPRSSRAGSCWTTCDVDGAVDVALSIIGDDHGPAVRDATVSRLVRRDRQPGQATAGRRRRTSSLQAWTPAVVEVTSTIHLG